MVSAILCDFARVILFPRDVSYLGRLDKHSGVFFLNDELLHYFANLKNRVSLHLFSSGRNYEESEIKAKLDLIFDQFFNTHDLGIEKTNPRVYSFIAEKIGKKLDEIVFIDDFEENVQAAKTAGLFGIHYVSNETTFTTLNKLLLIQ